MKRITLLLTPIVVITLAGCGSSSSKENITDCVSVDFEGYDGYGTAAYKVDTEDLILDTLAKTQTGKMKTHLLKH